MTIEDNSEDFELSDEDVGLLAQDVIGSLSNPEITEAYLTVRREYREAAKRAKRISRGSAGIRSTGNRMFWSSVLFTRISVLAGSVDKLLPDPKPREHWDFSSVASLVRNLAEAELVYQWLCRAGLDDDERQARFILLRLHDWGSRRRLFPEQFGDGEGPYLDLLRQFEENPVLQKYDDRRRKVAQRGEKTPFIQDDVLLEIGVEPAPFRRVYRFLSQHTHTGPVAFARMHEQSRGTGVETRLEKTYTMSALGFAIASLNRAIETHLDIFPDAETRPPHLTTQQITANVEREQGRSRDKRKSGRNR